MRSRTWTPAALSSERRRLSGVCWRVVEAQHVASTMKVVDTLAEQSLLETLLESTKPPVPAECRELHYLLATPFRYGAPYPSGSRFRRAGFSAGVFYGSTVPATAVAEAAFHRLQFFADSPNTPWPGVAGEYTAFAVKFKSGAALDLTVPPLSVDSQRWVHPTDYSACQDLADRARAARVDVLKYASARTAGGVNLALLTCNAFAARQPQERQTWRMHVGAQGVRALCDYPEIRLEFGRQAFADDPRIAGLNWER
jgi:RES domain